MIKEVIPPKVGRNIHLYDPCASRTVKPNFKRYDNDRPIIAITATEVFRERDGQVISHDDFVANLEQEPRSLIVCYGAETLLLKCHIKYKTNPHWQWKVSVTGDTLIHKKVVYFGFKRKNHNAGKHTYHIVLDINSFYRIHEWEERGDLNKLIKLGNEVRQFCNEFNLEIRPTATGLANQLLRHPMFYPSSRRKVPTFINEIARSHLPGNHYDVFCGTTKIEQATYIDQQAAHHYAASHTPLPSSNSIAAEGYRSESSKPYARYRTEPDSLYQRILSVHGLYCVWAFVPHLHPKYRRFAPPCIQKRSGLQKLWIWSNELRYIERFGVEIKYIISVYGSRDVDRYLPQFAKWAIKVQSRYPWLKTLTLMVYGLLAKRNSEFTTYFNQGKGEKTGFILSNQFVEGFGSSTKVVSPTTNVLQRGLIETYVRTLSLDMARQCQDRGREVVSIYADAIFIRTDDTKQLPLMIPWRNKGQITELEFECATRFKSNEMTRFPGTAKLKKEYIQATKGNEI